MKSRVAANAWLAGPFWWAHPDSRGNTFPTEIATVCWFLLSIRRHTFMAFLAISSGKEPLIEHALLPQLPFAVAFREHPRQAHQNRQTSLHSSGLILYYPFRFLALNCVRGRHKYFKSCIVRLPKGGQKHKKSDRPRSRTWNLSLRRRTR